MAATLPERGAGLPALLRDPRLWRGSAAAAIAAEPTGYAALDRALPGGGWPCGALSEILHARPGVGEISLALPLLARLSAAGRPVALVGPPFIPYAPALAAAGIDLVHLRVVQAQGDDALWVCEQLLQARAGAVLAWAGRLDLQTLRRLQLGAETGGGIALLYRSGRWAQEVSPAALRLQVWRARGVAQVQVLKCRGAQPQQRFALAQ
ncbi:MAG TPA: translesion DNA synthesis-associated protein ImuA [Solimonas sp.]|nr:translesion DNA synthesis-associated protein ImuA [Solimonas sp.]